MRIANRQWRERYVFLPGHLRACTGKEVTCRRFSEAVRWILRAGVQWREPPDRFGKKNSVFRRFARWEANGIWADMRKRYAQDAGMAAVVPDSTTERAHMCAAGGS